MKKSIIIATALWLSLLSWGANKPAIAFTERDYLMRPPYPAQSILAVLADGRLMIPECNVTLLHLSSLNSPFPGEPDRFIFYFYYIDIDALLYLNSGKAIPTSFYFPGALAASLMTASRNFSFGCEEVSHLEIVKSRCKIEAEDYSNFTKTVDYCAVKLPYRLEFLRDLSEVGASPLLDPENDYRQLRQ